MIDSHAHLDLDVFDTDRDEVIKRAKEAQVTKILSLGCTSGLDTEDKIYKLLNTYDFMYSSVGIHPHYAHSFSDESAKKIKTIAKHERFVAIGEIGLDFHYMQSSRENQINVFRKQIEIALETNLPIIIHVRDAFREAYDICASYSKKEKLRGVIHCFTGTEEHAKWFLDLGFYISFSGIITFKKTDELKKACLQTPLDRILIETDSPYLAPVPFRGKRNEPALVKYVAEEVARIKNTSFQEIDTITEANTKLLFGM